MKKAYFIIVFFIVLQSIGSRHLFGQDGITVAGGNGRGSAANQLSGPNDVFVDATGNVYVVDPGNERIQKWLPSASTGITVAGGNGNGSAANQLNNPFGVFVDATGNIYIGDSYNARVQKWASGGSTGVTVAGGNGPGSNANQVQPVGVFVDASGNLYVADIGNSRVQKWLPGALSGVTVAGGNGSGSAANQLNNISSVFVDLSGNIYVCDALNDRIQKWAPGASVGVTVAGGNGRGSQPNQLNFPWGVFVDADGNIYIADTGNDRIQQWGRNASSGVTVAGGHGRGAAANQLSGPKAVFVDPTGGIYTADAGNNRVQKFALPKVKYWVGPLNGNWSDRANWSVALDGGGGAEIPGILDSVIFTTATYYSSFNLLVHVDISPSIKALRIYTASTAIKGNITLYASSPILLRLTGSLGISVNQTLKDSTSADVPFKFVLEGAGRSQSTVYGTWIFEGSVPVDRSSGNGAGFTVEAGAKLSVEYLLINSYVYGTGSIFMKDNANYISSDASSLRFAAGTKYVLENSSDGIIPAATWDQALVLGLNSYATLPAPMIMIKGSIGRLQHPGDLHRYPNISVDLPDQAIDASLNLPDNTSFNGSLSILNTNNRNLTLLAPTGSNSSVNVIGGLLSINQNTRVALATASSAAPATSYRLQIGSFDQSGGNFSLQDYDNPLGSSILSIRGNLLQTGGTFITNSSTTNRDAKFVVEMVGPTSIGRPYGIVYNIQTIRMSGKTIDNGNQLVTLRISQDLTKSYGGYGTYDYGVGVVLLTPLTVGRLELLKGTLNATDTSIITVADPNPSAVTIGTSDSSYVNGPIRRWTNSSNVYVFPTGKGMVASGVHSDSCEIIPVSSQPSLYQAEYGFPGYSDLLVSPPLKGVSDAEYWNISKISGADASVRLKLKANVPAAAATDALVVAHYENGNWVAEHGTVLTPGNTTTGIVTSRPISNFGAFTLGYGDAANFKPTSVGGLNYKYYEGFFSTLPDFNTLTPVKTGNSANVDINIRRMGVNDSFLIVWEGSINIPTAGTYTFETISDDGSRLYFNGTAIVNNDGTHPPQSATGTVTIPAAGKYPITISFFENYGGESLEVYWTGPGIGRQLIPDAAFAADVPPLLSGLNYKYYEGDFNSLHDFSTLSPVKTGNSANVDLGVRPAGVNDHFAFVWEGYINIPTTGMYTFETLSDDGSKLYFNSLYAAGNTALVNNDGIHAPWAATGTMMINAGIYPISMTFFEKDGGERMEVYWTGPGIERQRIPDAAFTGTAPPLASGLNYKYFEGNFNSLPDFNMLSPVKTGKSPNIDLGVRPGGVDDNFAFMWEGYINIPTAGTYTFETVSDDGSKLYFNSLYFPGAPALVNNDGLHAPWPATGTINIPSAGIYPIAMTYFEKDGGETMQIYWTGPGIDRQQIPDAAFSSDAPGLLLTMMNTRSFEGATNQNETLSSEKKAMETMKAYPNPFKESFNIDFYNTSAANKVRVSIYDLRGRLIYSHHAGSLAAGYNILKIDLGRTEMVNGIYIAKLSINGIISETVKLVKARR